ncbi:response regulator [Roseibium sp. HPY-6]|uniref:response regulator n=1 Tax=Roseibium sp. HPY-6 TaxID=3229852 RepID=UPI00338EC31A
MLRDKWDLSRISCLIAEDNPHMRTIVRSVLTGFGVRSIFEASDGAEALELVVDRKPDIVLLDWVMNPFGGSEFLRILRGDHDMVISTVPVLVISAHANRATILEAMGIGVHGFVAKPIAPAILYRHIGDILERQEMQGRSKGIMGPGSQQKSRKLNIAGISDDASDAEPEADTGLALL